MILQYFVVTRKLSLFFIFSLSVLLEIANIVHNALGVKDQDGMREIIYNHIAIPIIDPSLKHKQHN